MYSRSASERYEAHHLPISTSCSPILSFGVGMSPRNAASQLPMITGQPSSRTRSIASAGCGPTATSPRQMNSSMPSRSSSCSTASSARRFPWMSEISPRRTCGAFSRSWRLGVGDTMRLLGAVAEWLGRGLQSLVHQFDSGRRLSELGLVSKALLPGFRMCPALGSVQEVLERNVHERESRFGEQLVREPELPAHEESAPSFLFDPGSHRQLALDRDWAPIAQEHAPRDSRKAVPGGDEPARLIDQRRDHPAVRETRAALMALVEREGRLVAVGALGLGLREVEADRVVAAPEASRVVVRRDLQRIPPRSKWALKKFSEPDVAMAAEAEISSASVAAATIWAKR